ncbi:MAG: ATP-dependent helicase [Candidatus Omnitrophica bacterium]|nr:ATP-dependent helicase [Candidatus Omnitrophota bacterium]
MNQALQTDPLLEDLTPAQREAVIHETGPLLIIAGAGTGKTTVIARRIAWLIATKRARPEEILALTFTEKAAAEMEERIDLLVPYGYLDVTVNTFHAFGDQLLRDHAMRMGLTPQFRVLSKAEQLVFLRQHVFDLPLQEFRPLTDPTRFLDALAAVFARAKDEAADPEEFLAYAESARRAAEAAPHDAALGAQARRAGELAKSYAAYHRLLREADAADFGDQVLLAAQLLERHPDALTALQRRFRYVLVDEFQDTNFTQFRLLQLLAAPEANITVVADDDQSIYKWRGAAISNVLKFLDHYASVRTVVLTENFRSSQPILDCAYRLIRFNDPDRLEVRQGIDKRLVARAAQGARAQEPPHFHVFDTVSSEADWVARTIRDAVESGARRPGDFAILVRSNREADLFLRALNVAGVPWQFSGASGLFAREESKMLLSCLKALADPDDSLSWYHVASSPLYRCPMRDLTTLLAEASRTNQSLRAVIQRLEQHPVLAGQLSEEGRRLLDALVKDVDALLEWSRTHSGGQVLHRWLMDRGFVAGLSRAERTEELLQLQTVARFFNQLRRVEELAGGSLPSLMEHLELFQAMGNEPVEEDDAWADRVNVLTLHKAKGLEFPVVFLVGLVQGRFPTPQRRDPIELPEPLIKDILPAGDYHLQEERRLFYVGMTRAKEGLHLTCSYDYGGKTVRKVSQFVLEALDLATPSPPAKRASARELIERSSAKPPLPVAHTKGRASLRVDPHGVDDYLTCPLKYRYSHVLKIPVMRHHLVVYGAALHKAVEAFFRGRLEGREMAEDELLAAFERHWSSEGFLTREHEELRLAQGREALRRFHAQQRVHPEHPYVIEGKFKFPLDDLLVVGRWDRVDREGDRVVIIDYKSSEIREQRVADERARESLQLLVYALAWHTLHGQMPDRVELRFLETGLVGRARFDEDDFSRAKEFLRQAARGIRAQEFPARPQEFACRWCAFQSICPFAFQSR